MPALHPLSVLLPLNSQGAHKSRRSLSSFTRTQGDCRRRHEFTGMQEGMAAETSSRTEVWISFRSEGGDGKGAGRCRSDLRYRVSSVGTTMFGSGRETRGADAGYVRLRIVHLCFDRADDATLVSRFLPFIGFEPSSHSLEISDFAFSFKPLHLCSASLPSLKVPRAFVLVVRTPDAGFRSRSRRLPIALSALLNSYFPHFRS
ncbi:hypothetical protein SCHPADRAFT_548759 [Schizopora paradoxa]|uniref:Uncharacterized protein n=1 Tax=Schizopora paradoxa TaxID=27342 RepID=A0A0H2RDD0_9AGAM|nr:hypothetical protein SCHPADRAFT_548759 [Schizopora paradoxa]